jgi:hypothetical protein
VPTWKRSHETTQILRSLRVNAIADRRAPLGWPGGKAQKQPAVENTTLQDVSHLGARAHELRKGSWIPVPIGLLE